MLLNEQKSLKADIVFIEKTHFDRSRDFSFAHNLYPTVFMASQDKAGVAILLSNSCQL